MFLSVIQAGLRTLEVVDASFENSNFIAVLVDFLLYPMALFSRTRIAVTKASVVAMMDAFRLE